MSFICNFHIKFIFQMFSYFAKQRKINKGQTIAIAILKSKLLFFFFLSILCLLFALHSIIISSFMFIKCITTNFKKIC